jgi:DNA-binding Xre family transcriptional regulator
MLTYNFNRVFKARGIERPFTYLRKAGFSEHFASKVKDNKVRHLDLKYLEKLCILLRCTPNDVVQWVPDSGDQLDANHPMCLIQKPERDIDLTKTLNSVPLGLMAEIEKMIVEKIKESK